MKKRVKIISTILLIIMILATAADVALATSASASYSPSGFGGTTSGTTGVENIAKRVIGIVRVVGTAVSVLTLVILGIKYMTASPEGKADYKSTMIPYIVGAVLVFSATWIATIIYNMATGLSDTTGGN